MRGFLFSLILVSQVSLAQGFKEYPGAVFDQKYTDKSQGELDKAQLKSKSKVYISTDSFEKVKAFYQALGKEYSLGMPTQKLEDGTEIKKAFFIFDGAKDLNTSSNWVNIQTPFVGDFEFKNGKVTFLDIRKGKTVIQRSYK